MVAQHGLGRDRARRILRVLEDGGRASASPERPGVLEPRRRRSALQRARLADALEGVGSLVCVPLNFPSQSVGLVYVDRLNDNLLGRVQAARA